MFQFHKGASNCEELRVKGYGSGDYSLKLDDDATFMVVYILKANQFKQ